MESWLPKGCRRRSATEGVLPKESYDCAGQIELSIDRYSNLASYGLLCTYLNLSLYAVSLEILSEP